MIPIVTTNRPKKSFAWSYSKLKNFETCPKRHFSIDVQKDYKEEESDQLKWGDMVHKQADAFLKGKTDKFPPGMGVLEGWCRKLLTTPGNILSEQQLAITKDFGATEWFAHDAWYRAKADVIKSNGPVALVLDWKTGKILEDSVQLALTAACVFYHHPEIQRIRSEFIWLKEGPDISSHAIIDRKDLPDLWRGLWPRIEALERAYAETNFPPLPGRLCRKWCPVSKCPYHGQ